MNRKLLDFLKRTFLDARGAPDGKLLTLFAFSLVCLAQYPIGWIWHVWAPDYIWSPSMLLIGAGLGFGTWETRTKIKTETADTGTTTDL